MDNHGVAMVKGGNVTFSYIDSFGRAHTDTKPLLTAAEIVKIAKERDERFDTAGEWSRESDETRAERKYVAAQPGATLREAWALAKGVVREELATMLDGNSHHGTSDPRWLAQNADPAPAITDDHGEELGHG